jgi:hypothetical protein
MRQSQGAHDRRVDWPLLEPNALAVLSAASSKASGDQMAIRGQSMLEGTSTIFRGPRGSGAVPSDEGFEQSAPAGHPRLVQSGGAR